MIPIQAIPKTTTLSLHFFRDVFGSVTPNLNINYKYYLLLVDPYSLWTLVPIHYAIRLHVTLLHMFSYAGLSTEVTSKSSDSASYFKSDLTREFLKRFEVSPRFHTLHASSSTGLAERHVQTIKRILRKLAVENPSKLHEYFPYTLRAMREGVDNPLQLQPFMLVTGGRCMRQPFCVFCMKPGWGFVIYQFLLVNGLKIS